MWPILPKGAQRSSGGPTRPTLASVPSLTDLVRNHTDLDDEDVAWLQLLQADWQIIADLSFADLVLWLPDQEGKGYWAAGQMRPTTGPAHRDRLHPDRHVVSPFGIAFADQPALRVRRVDQRPPTDRHERADHVVDVRRRAGRRPHLGTAPEPVALAVWQPKHQVSEGEVGDDLPVGDQEVQP